MGILFILLALTLPFLLVTFFIYRRKLAERYRSPLQQGGLGNQRGAGKSNFLIAIIVLLSAVIAVMLVKPNFFNRSATKFTPEELLSLMDDFNIRQIAADCNEKKFSAFHTPGLYHLHNPTTFFNFYYTGGHEDTSEEISLFNNEKFISYSLTKPKAYKIFIDHIVNDLNAIKYTDNLHPDFETCTHYLVNNVIVIDCGFNMAYKTYQVAFSTPDEIDRIIKLYIADSISSEKERLISISAQKARSEHFVKEFLENANATVTTNNPHAFKASDNFQGNTITSILKGGRVKVNDAENGYVFCDYVSDDCTVSSAWFLESDISQD